MNISKYSDNGNIVVGGGHLYIGKTSDIKTKIPSDTATATEYNTYIEALTDELQNVALVLGAGKINTENKYIDAQVDGETYDQFPYNPSVTFNTGLAEINIEHLAKFITGGKYNKSTDGVETLKFDGQTVPYDCFLMFVMEEKKTGCKYVFLMPRCKYNGAFTFDTDVSKQVTPDVNFSILKPSKESIENSGINEYYHMIKIPSSSTTTGTESTEGEDTTGTEE